MQHSRVVGLRLEGNLVLLRVCFFLFLEGAAALMASTGRLPLFMANKVFSFSYSSYKLT